MMDEITDLLALDPNTTRALPADFVYLEPLSKAEALELLHRHREEGIRVLAGGTDLLVKMKVGALRPRYVLHISRLAELGAVTVADGLSIGALASMAAVQREPAVKEGYSVLHEAIRSVAGPAIRHMGTIGGNLCNASPAADTAPALLTLNATCLLESVRGQRRLPLAEFFAGPGKTHMAPDELLTKVYVPAAAAASGSAFLKVTRVAADLAKINVAVYLERAGDTCTCCRIALGSVAPTPVRVAAAEQVLAGAQIRRDVVAAAAAHAAAEIRPIDDIRSTAEYRRHMARVAVEEALLAAWSRSGGAGL